MKKIRVKRTSIRVANPIGISIKMDIHKETKIKDIINSVFNFIINVDCSMLRINLYLMPSIFKIHVQ